MKLFVAMLMSFTAVQAAGSGASLSLKANPIRRVVTMLQNIQTKVQEEGEKETELFNKYMCYCKNGVGTLEASIADAEAKLADTSAKTKEAEGAKSQLEQDLKDHKADRTSAKGALAEATSLREKEAAAFAAQKSESSANIAAMEKAIAALEKGTAGAFIQTSAAKKILALVQASDNMQDVDRQDVMAFLTNTQEYAPQSGEITGILKQLHETMASDLAEATAAEESAIKSYEELSAAKQKEIAALTEAIEDKMTRVGELGVSITEMQGESADAAESLEDDKLFLADLKKNCGTKKEEWDAIVKARSEELVALAETIKLLNDDSSLELFKKTLPSAGSSFMQVTTSSASTKARALAVLRAAQVGRARKSVRLDLIALALHGKTAQFGKVIAMVDEMVVALAKEQDDDTSKKEYCITELDTKEDAKKALDREVSDAEASIADAKEQVSALVEDIKALEAGIKALDASVAEATEQRKEDNTAFKELMASNGAAKELIGLAKNRLNKFYNPALYAPPPKAELSEEDRINVNMGGTAPPTPAPGGVAGTGITYFVQLSAHRALEGDDEAPGPAPEAPGSFKKKSEESTGVIAMMDILVADLDKEMQVAEVEEKNAQAAYEKMTADAATKRAADAKLAADKEAARADSEAMLQKHGEDKAAATKELMTTLEMISALHGECDWLLQNFDTRKEARAAEVDSLKKAKAVLSGADYS